MKAMVQKSLLSSIVTNKFCFSDSFSTNLKQVFKVGSPKSDRAGKQPLNFKSISQINQNYKLYDKPVGKNMLKCSGANRGKNQISLSARNKKYNIFKINAEKELLNEKFNRAHIRQLKFSGSFYSKTNQLFQNGHNTQVQNYTTEKSSRNVISRQIMKWKSNLPVLSILKKTESFMKLQEKTAQIYSGIQTYSTQRAPSSLESTKELNTVCDSLSAEEDLSEGSVNSDELIADSNKFTLRTHNCGQLNDSNIGENVRLMGWVEFLRLNKFVILRDKYGRIQLVIPESREDLVKIVNELTYESVLHVEGTVSLRPRGQENPNMKTGLIEINVNNVKIINKAEPLPYYLKDKSPHEHLRMKYRYLDIRKENMQNNLRIRCETLHKMRRFLIEHLDFIEVETPTLFCRTPGGAQEFIVPTKTKGEFYSLVQSPQQFKQLLMVGCLDRYFQIARCYRDEGSRTDRQPEFTQLDIEMSFCDRDGVINLVEDLLKYIWPQNMAPICTPFPRITYNEAMELYGTDKPDLRFDWKINNLTELFLKNETNNNGKIDLKNFSLERDFAAHAFVVPRREVDFSKNIRKKIQDEAKSKFTNCSLLLFKVNSISDIEQTLKELFSFPVSKGIIQITGCRPGDVICMGLGPRADVLQLLGETRVNITEYVDGDEIEFFNKNPFTFVWVIDFPLFEEKAGQIISMHHPFTRPHPDDEHMLTTDPLKVKSLHYDLILNGNEVGGGSIRISDSEMQREILENILQLDPTHLQHLLKALSSGAPTHGGIALGIDRLMAIICGTKTIRDVIAFPKNSGRDPLSGAPSEILDADKILYHIS